MYNVPLPITAGGSAGGAAVLAHTGFATAHFLVAAVTLVFFGAALLRLVPRREA